MANLNTALPITTTVTAALSSGSTINDPHPKLHTQERDYIESLRAAHNTLSATVAALGSGGGGAAASAHPASAAALGVKATLTRGYHSTAIQVLGDSTGDESDEWFGVLADKLGTAYPTYSVIWRSWNVTNQMYDAPVARTAGTANGGGDRYVEIVNGGMKHVNAVARTGAVEVRAKVRPNGGWKPGGAAASRTIAARWNASGTNRGWIFALSETGFLTFERSTDGATSAATFTSTVAVPFATEAGWVRVAYNNANAQVTFYTSTDGNTWTQLGDPSAAGSAAAISGTTYDFQIGARNGTPSDFFNGRFYWVEVYASAGFPDVPCLPEMWEPSGGDYTLGGAPQLVMVNGSASGQNIAYFNDSNRRVKLAAPHGQQLVLCSDGHNEGNVTGYGWRTLLAGWLTDLKSRVSQTPIVYVAQNPTLANVDTFKGRELRGATGVSVAYANGFHAVDVWPEFSRNQTTLATELEDNIHPGPVGSDIWATYMFETLGF
jgi:hypothetical protein